MGMCMKQRKERVEKQCEEREKRDLKIQEEETRKSYSNIDVFEGKEGEPVVTYTEISKKLLANVTGKRNVWYKAENNEDKLVMIAEEIKERARIQKFQDFEIGGLLLAAKKLVPKGEWGNWLNANFPYCKSHARNFMNLYKYCVGTPQVVEDIPPAILKEICRPDFDEKLREEIFKTKGVRAGVNIPKLREISREIQENKIEFDDPKVQAILRDMKYKDVEMAFNDIEKRISNIARETIRNLKKLQGDDTSGLGVFGKIPLMIDDLGRFLKDEDLH